MNLQVDTGPVSSLAEHIQMEDPDGSGVFRFLNRAPCCFPATPFLLCSFPLGVAYKSPSISRTLWPIYSQAHKPFPLTSTGSQRQHPTQLRERPEVPHSSLHLFMGQIQHHQQVPEKSLPTPTCLSEAFIPVPSHLSSMSCVEMCKPVTGMRPSANWQ